MNEKEQLKQIITTELDRRIDSLEAHQMDEIVVTGNQYEELNQVLAKIIGRPLLNELRDVKKFIREL